ncbi:MAG: hypothetical protein IRY99_02785 [Isosphaeraceae bacterium]|nr:hypothetical protein [Isosphaeraceae bacterium]
MIERVISGGQTGVDQAAWRAARAAGIATGGWMPRGFATETGPRPEFAALYGAVEHASADYAERTIANVRSADGTLVFAGDRPGPGTALTIAACHEAGVPILVLHPDRLSGDAAPEHVAAWIAAHGLRTLNVAGERESTMPGLGARIEAYLLRLFRLINRGN